MTVTAALVGNFCPPASVVLKEAPTILTWRHRECQEEHHLPIRYNMKIINRTLQSAFVAALALLISAAPNAHAQKLFVNQNATGAGTGASWTDALTTLQEALQQTELGLADEVWVAAGTYSPGTNQTDTYLLVDGITLIGGFAGTESTINERVANFHAVNPTILDGDYDNNSDSAFGDDTANFSVVTITGNVLIDGFIITGGNESRAPSAVNADGVGGGIKIDGGTNTDVSPVIQNTILRNNFSSANGASINGVNAGYTLINVLITESGGAPEPTDAVAAAGGRTTLLAASPDYQVVFKNVTIAGNGGQSFFDAEAGSTVTLAVDNSIFYNNALSLPENSSTFQETQATFTNVIFEQESTFCVPGGITCTNVVSTDPMLRMEDGFYTLTEGSVGLDYGDDNLLPMDGTDMDGDGDTSELLPLDGAFRLRVQGASVDAGAFEGTDPVEATVSENPDISVNPTTLDFGQVAFSTTDTLDVVVTNNGVANLEVTEITISGTNANNFTIIVGNEPVTIGAGANSVLSIEFSPMDLGAKEADLTITSNDPDNGVIEVALIGEGAENTSTEDESLPSRFVLKGNYPNPFNPVTTLLFDLPVQANVKVMVYDLIGQEVMQVPTKSFSSGASHRIEIEASDLASGIYFYHVVADFGTSQKIETGLMTLLK